MLEHGGNGLDSEGSKANRHESNVPESRENVGGLCITIDVEGLLGVVKDEGLAVAIVGSGPWFLLCFWIFDKREL